MLFINIRNKWNYNTKWRRHSYIYILSWRKPYLIALILLLAVNCAKFWTCKYLDDLAHLLNPMMLQVLVCPNPSSELVGNSWNACYIPCTMKLLGGTLVSLRPSVCPSVCLSVCPSRIPYPLCSTYSSGWIHFIFIILPSNCRRCVACKIADQISKFEFFKICYFDFVFFWLFWCESLVWVILRQRGVSQNAGVLVVLVLE